MSIVMTSDNEVHLMANAIRQYISERCDKKEVTLLSKDENKKKKYSINTKLVQIAESIFAQSNEQLQSIKKAKKIRNQTALEFQQDKHQQLLSLLNDFRFDERLIDIIREYREKLQILKQEHEPCTWLNYWSGKAEDISFATHVAKLTHSSSKSISVYDKTTSTKPSFLTTSSLNETIIDTATANAASAPAGEILTIEVNGKTLLDYIKKGDYSPFNELTESQEEIDEWMAGFKQAYDKEKKNSHFLSKQVYFPVSEDKYHLLMPLVSSSMAHALFLKFKAFFADEVIDQRKKHKYHDQLAVSFPKRASLNIPGKPQTASSLNGERGGRLTLLSAMPPKWAGKQKLPISQRNLFDKSLGYKLREEINDLQRLLLIIKSKEIGMKKPEMHRAIIRNIEAVANTLFDEINKINLLSKQTGWTVHSAFPLHQQWLLEPNREDEAMIDGKNKKQWLDRVAEDFSFWLNQQLKHKKLNLTPIQQRLWKDIFTEQVRNYIAMQESSL